MSERKLADWINAYMQFTEKTESPRMYRLWTGISVVAAALQRKCFVPWGTLTFYPNLYVILVGPSGVRKGTALDPGHDILEEIHVNIAAEATSRQALIRRLADSKAETIDKVSGLPLTHCSMTVFSHEFTVFLGYQNKELMSDLCDWYDCRKKWIYDTKNMGTDEINGVWVNIVGGTTPDLINTSLPQDAVGSGLTARIIFVTEFVKGKSISKPFQTPQEMALKITLINDLDKLSMMSGPFAYTENFINTWDKWYTINDNSPPPFNDDKFAGYFSRRATHVMKLSMVMSASRDNETVLEEQDLLRAIKILEATEVKMPRTFLGYGKSDISDLMPRLMGYIEVKKDENILIRKIVEEFYADADKDTVERALLSLEYIKYIDLHWEKDGDYVTFREPKKGDKRFGYMSLEEE